MPKDCGFRSIGRLNEGPREYHSRVQERMTLRRTGWLLALVVMALVAAPAVRAQQPLAEEALPDRIIRGLFRSLFGGGETKKPDQPEAQPAPQPEAPSSPGAAAAPLSLHAAIAKGDFANALKMIEQGADIEAKDPGAGASALHYAVMKGSLPMIGMLLQRGADVNSRTKSGTTPLHTAVLYNHYEAAEYLIDKGANVNSKSSSGVTPLELARTAKHKHLEKLLRDRGAS